MIARGALSFRVFLWNLGTVGVSALVMLTIVGSPLGGVPGPVSYPIDALLLSLLVLLVLSFPLALFGLVVGAFEVRISNSVRAWTGTIGNSAHLALFYVVVRYAPMP